MDPDENITPPAQFRIFSGLLKASKAPDGKMRLHGVASSTTKDLHGDTMMRSALEDMERSANAGLTIFLNHSYNVPEDVGGSVERAAIKTRGVDHETNPNYDLDFDVVINDVNPRAVQGWEAIQKGAKLGLSIGAMIPEGGARRNKDGSYLIDHVELLETSIVGIPANPRSWVEYAVKALNVASTKAAQTIPLSSPTLTLDQEAGTYNITGSLGDVRMMSVEPTVVDDATEEIIEEAVVEAAPIEPDVQDTSVTIIQIDTGDESSDESSPADAPASQDAPSSQPETESGLLDETADGDDTALGDTVSQSATELRTFTSSVLVTVERLTSELASTRVELAKAVADREIAINERDRVAQQASDYIKSAAAIVDKVASLPLPRKTAVESAGSDLRRLGAVYDEDFISLLEGRK